MSEPKTGGAKRVSYFVIACPECHAWIELPDDDDEPDNYCGSCGATFDVRTCEVVA